MFHYVNCHYQGSEMSEKPSWPLMTQQLGDVSLWCTCVIALEVFSGECQIHVINIFDGQYINSAKIQLWIQESLLSPELWPHRDFI